MEFTRIDLDNVSEEELLFTIKDNIRTAKLMEEEINIIFRFIHNILK